MKKMPFRFARRVRHLEIKTYCPTKNKARLASEAQSSGRNGQVCPSCVLPIVVAFIFVFTVIQLIVIHRTIVNYKSRSLAFEEVYGPSHNDSKSQGDLLAFSKKFDSAWPNASHVVEWKPSLSYPYRLPGVRHPPIDHIWKVTCPDVPTKLHGNISINTKKDVDLNELVKENVYVRQGGIWSPVYCKPRFHVALIIPYRFRWNHLKLLISVLHPMLRRQEMSYQVFVAEQFGNYTFNKGLLMNAAFLLAVNSSNTFDCVIFHDVDLLPETDRNIYGCANSPAHLSVSIDAYGYRLPYSKLVGGVFAVSVNHFIQVNGYSNLYWGWGAEDDDLYKRLIANQLPINRPRPDLAKYKMLQHGRRAVNQFISPLIRTARVRWIEDGLTTCHFRLVSSTSQALFTRFLVDVGQPSYSVLEPNIRLESMIPSPTPSEKKPFHSNVTFHHQHSHPREHSARDHSLSHRSPGIVPSRQVLPQLLTSFPQNKNELFLSGIARDERDDGDDSLPSRHGSDIDKNEVVTTSTGSNDRKRSEVDGWLGNSPQMELSLYFRKERQVRSASHQQASSGATAQRTPFSTLIHTQNFLGKNYPAPQHTLDPDIPVEDDSDEDI